MPLNLFEDLRASSKTISISWFPFQIFVYPPDRFHIVYIYNVLFDEWNFRWISIGRDKSVKHFTAKKGQSTTITQTNAIGKCVSICFSFRNWTECTRDLIHSFIFNRNKKKNCLYFMISYYICCAHIFGSSTDLFTLSDPKFEKKVSFFYTCLSKQPNNRDMK